MKTSIIRDGHTTFQTEIARATTYLFCSYCTFHFILFHVCKNFLKFFFMPQSIREAISKRSLSFVKKQPLKVIMPQSWYMTNQPGPWQNSIPQKKHVFVR